MTISISRLELPLKFEWKLSRNATRHKTNLIIHLDLDGYSGLGEVAPNIRYGETPELIEEQFHSLFSEQANPQTVLHLMEEIQTLPVCQSLKMGLDMARQHLLAARKQVSLSESAGLPPARPRPMAFTVPVMDPADVKAFMLAWNVHRFPWLKIKVNEALATDMVREVLKQYDGTIAIDGNEAWKSVEGVLEFQRQVSHPRILFLEQPLPAAQKEDYINLKPLSSMEIWGDESVLIEPDVQFWKGAFAGINVKLMKAGSFEKAIALLRTAKSAGLKTMIGCMVETGLGISAAMALESLADYIDLDGFLLIKEDPFAKVKEENGFIFPW